MIFQRTAQKRFFPWVVGIFLGVTFFFVYSFLSLAAPGIYNSPDENANAVFAIEMAERNKLYRLEPLNLVLDDRLHPRSVKVVDDVQVPGGFLGLPILYGLLSKVFGVGAGGFFTPLMAVLGALAWGLFLAHHFRPRVGWFGAVLLLITPVWWYWASRTMMPNILLTSLLLWGTYFLSVAPIGGYLKRVEYEGLNLLRRADGALAGIFFALSLAVRLSAAYWLLLAALTLLILAWRRLPWERLIICGLFLLMTLIPFFVFNQSLYGNWLTTGYGDVAATVSQEAVHDSGARWLGPLRSIVFPLGFSSEMALNNFIEFGIKYFWWWSLAVLAAIIVLIGQRRRRSKSPDAVRLMLAVGGVISVWLIFFYGSWQVPDNPDPGLVGIGSSYFRYWIPIFLFGTWPMALAFDHLWQSKKRLRLAVPVVLIGLAALSAGTVFGAEYQGLAKVLTDLQQYQAEQATVLDNTENQAIIIVEQADKYLYPQRAVLYPLRSDSTYELLPVMVENQPTYYFGLTLPVKDLQWLQSDKMPQSGLTIEPVIAIGDKTLYEFTPLDNE